MNIKKAVHHIRHTRPQWYKEYHKWEYHAVLHWITFTVSSVIILVGFLNFIFQVVQKPTIITKANAATTVLTQTINAGSLTLSNTGNQTLSSTGIATAAANTTGTLGVISVEDARGTGVGWSATATSTHFVKVNSAVKVSGSNNTVTTDGSSTYNNATAGTYTITIDGGGSSGVATYTVSGLETQGTTTTGAGVAVGTRGVTVTFASATYVVGDSWTIRVDVIPVTDLQITPSAVTTISGSSSNVTAGSQHTFSSTADAATIMSASAGYGLGSYQNTPDLQLTIPANSYANTYTATVTETAS